MVTLYPLNFNAVYRKMMIKNLSSSYTILRYLFAQRQYRIIFLFFISAYFLIFSVTTGMIIYYPHGIKSLMHASGLEIPYARFSMVAPIPDWQNPSLVLIPTGNVEFVFQFGSSLASVSIIVLTGINFMLLASTVKNRVRFKTKRFTLVGFLAAVPALLTVNSCCVSSIGGTLLSAIAPSSILLTLQYDLNWELDLTIVVLLFLSMLYSCKSLNSRLFPKRT